MLIEPRIYTGPKSIGNPSGRYCVLIDAVEIIGNIPRFVGDKNLEPLKLRPDELFDRFRAIAKTEFLWWWDGKSEDACSDAPVHSQFSALYVPEEWFDDVLFLIQRGIENVQREITRNPDRIRELLKSWGRSRCQPGLLRLDGIDEWGGFQPLQAVFGYDGDGKLVSPQDHVKMHIPLDVKCRG